MANWTQPRWWRSRGWRGPPSTPRGTTASSGAGWTAMRCCCRRGRPSAPADPPRHRGPWPAAPARAQTLAMIMARYGGGLRASSWVVPWALGAHGVPSRSRRGGRWRARPVRGSIPGGRARVRRVEHATRGRGSRGRGRVATAPGAEPRGRHDGDRGIGFPRRTDGGTLLGVVEGVSGRSIATGPRDRWAPFVFRVVRARGRELRGQSAAPGAGAGRSRWVASLASLHDPSSASVVGARVPLPQLSPMLWHASGVVTAGGDPRRPPVRGGPFARRPRRGGGRPRALASRRCPGGGRR